MAKSRTPRLKVFQAQFGFFDSVVAAPSQAAALRAWGTRQDLFATGDARIATDEATVAAALEHPGKPLQRAVGTKDPFLIEPSKPKAPGSARSKPAKPMADRSRLDRAEAELGRVEERRERQEAELRQAEDKLKARRSEARETYEVSRKAAVAAVSKALAAYRAEGGRD